jgi:hypothetical protein
VNQNLRSSGEYATSYRVWGRGVAGSANPTLGGSHLRSWAELVGYLRHARIERNEQAVGSAFDRVFVFSSAAALLTGYWVVTVGFGVTSADVTRSGILGIAVLLASIGGVVLSVIGRSISVRQGLFWLVPLEHTAILATVSAVFRNQAGIAGALIAVAALGIASVIWPFALEARVNRELLLRFPPPQLIAVGTWIYKAARSRPLQFVVEYSTPLVGFSLALYFGFLWTKVCLSQEVNGLLGWQAVYWFSSGVVVAACTLGLATYAARRWDYSE